MLLPTARIFVAGSSYPGYEAFEAAFRVTFLITEEELTSDEKKDLLGSAEWLEIGAAWFANPAFWLALICIAAGWRECAVVIAGLAVLLSMSVLLHWWQNLPRLPGYWFWWGSFVAALLGAMFVLPRRAPAYAVDFAPMADIPEIPFASSTNDPLTPV
jgi:hypothetical protein